MSLYIPILLRIANGLDNIAKAIDRYTDTSCPDLFRELEKQENRKESLKHWNSTLRGKARKKGTEGTESQVAGIGTEADERKRKRRGKYRRRKQKVSTCGTAVGAKQGRREKKKQKSE